MTDLLGEYKLKFPVGCYVNILGQNFFVVGIHYDGFGPKVNVKVGCIFNGEVKYSIVPAEVLDRE